RSGQQGTAPLDLVPDGGFENGPPPNSNWTELKTTSCEWISDPSGAWGIPAHSGTYAFWAGGYCSTPNSDIVFQQVTVPTDDPTLFFFANYYRVDADDPPARDFFYVIVNTTRVKTVEMSQANNSYPNWMLEQIDLSAYAGQTIKLRFLGWSRGQYTGNVLLDDIGFGEPPPPPEPPANDDFDTPVGVAGLPATETEDTTAATVAPDDPLFSCAGTPKTGRATVWFAYTPGSDMVLHADTNTTSYDTILGVWTGTRGSLVEEACDDDGGDGLQSSLEANLTGGVTYYIEVAEYGSGLGADSKGAGAPAVGGSLVLNLSEFEPPPPLTNDDFDTPYVVTGLPDTVNEDTTTATTAPDDPLFTCAGTPKNGLATVWFAYTPTSDMVLHADTNGTSYDTILGVWTGTRGSLVEEACDDDGGDGLQSSLDANLTGGVTYYIEVAQYGSGLGADRKGAGAPAVGGSMVLNLSVAP
ncbi:MAG: hypothetical protein HY784_07755, partial [Chloroflexi bacterium]|nr:hypothetical protein [Chloroflexota bacterium]